MLVPANTFITRRETVLPIKATIEDIEALGGYLKGQVGWVPLERVKKTIDSKYADNRKLEALKRIGILERDGTNIKLSARGREYATAADERQKQDVMKAGLREVTSKLSGGCTTVRSRTPRKRSLGTTGTTSTRTSWKVLKVLH